MRRLLLALTTLALGASACRSAPEARPSEPSTPAATSEAAAPAPDAEAFRDQPPEAGEPPALVLPRFERAQLDNGLTVLVSTRRELPLVYVGLAFAVGGAADPAGQWGLADLTYKMLLEGAGGKDTLALDQAFQDLGVSPGVSVSADGAQMGVAVLQRNAETALGLFAQVARRPTLAAKDFERRKKLQLAELTRALGSPGFLAQQAFLRTVFGAQHPYGHLTSGLPATVEAVTARDVKAFYEAHVGPRTTAVVMTGDVTLEQAVALAQKQFGDWKGKAAPLPPPPAPPVPKRTQVLFVPKAGLDQTVVIFGRPGLSAGQPDEAALELATTVFGGFFGSRLNMNLREDKGYSYGANARADGRLGVGSVTASSSVRADVTGLAVQEFVKELQGVRERPISAKELESAREGLIRGFPGGFESVEGLGASASALFTLRRPLDEYERSVEDLRKATPEDVQRVAEQYLAADTMQVVLVGDPDTVPQQVEALGLGQWVVDSPAKAPGTGR